MKKRAIIFVMLAISLFTVCTAPPAHAIVPVVAWVIWGVAAGTTSVAVAVDETRGDHKQVKANNQGQEEPHGIKDTAADLQQNPG